LTTSYQLIIGVEVIVAPVHTHTHIHTQTARQTDTHTHTLARTSRDEVTTPTQIFLPDNTQHSQEPEVHAHTGIRNRNFSIRAAADPQLRPR